MSGALPLLSPVYLQGGNTDNIPSALHVQVHVCVCVCARAHARVGTYIYVHARVHTQTLTHTPTCLCVYELNRKEYITENDKIRVTSF